MPGGHASLETDQCQATGFARPAGILPIVCGFIMDLEKLLLRVGPLNGEKRLRCLQNIVRTQPIFHCLSDESSVFLNVTSVRSKCVDPNRSYFIHNSRINRFHRCSGAHPFFAAKAS